MLFRVFERFTLYESSVTCVIYISTFNVRTTVPLAVCATPDERTLAVLFAFCGIANVSAVNPRLCVRTFAGRES